MVFSYAVRAVYVESCSMFVRGGVYRAVKEALGGTLAKFSVSALMFDYILTGPISGVSAGQYLARLDQRTDRNTCTSARAVRASTSAHYRRRFAIVVTVYFWWENTKGVSESSEKALHIMKLVTVMVVMLIAWCIYTVDRAAFGAAALAASSQSSSGRQRAGLAGAQQPAAHVRHHRHFHRAGPFRAGHERRRIAGAGLSRNRKSQAAESAKSRARNFRLQPGFHFAGFVFRGDDHSRRRAPGFPGEPDRRPGHEPGRAASARG